MMAALEQGPAGILCVDDNALVAEALRHKLSRTPGFEWRGWLPDADALVQRAADDCPELILLDLDMPGRDPFDALAEVVELCPKVKTVVFSGHVRKDLIDRAIDSGAWGYIAKSDGEEALIDALRQIVAGEFTMSPEVRRTWSA